MQLRCFTDGISTRQQRRWSHRNPDSTHIQPPPPHPYHLYAKQKCPQWKRKAVGQSRAEQRSAGRKKNSTACNNFSPQDGAVLEKTRRGSRKPASNSPQCVVGASAGEGECTVGARSNPDANAHTHTRVNIELASESGEIWPKYMNEVTQLNFPLNESTTERQKDREREKVWVNETQRVSTRASASWRLRRSTHSTSAATQQQLLAAANLCHNEHICVAYFWARTLACSHAVSGCLCLCLCLCLSQLLRCVPYIAVNLFCDFGVFFLSQSR